MLVADTATKSPLPYVTEVHGLFTVLLAAPDGVVHVTPSFIIPPFRLTVTWEITLVLLLVRRVKAVAAVAAPPGAIVDAEMLEPLLRVVTWARANVWVASEKDEARRRIVTATERKNREVFMLRSLVTTLLIKDFINTEVTLSKGDYSQHRHQILGESTSFLWQMKLVLAQKE